MAQPAATVPDETAVQAQTPKKELGPVFKLAAPPTKWLDDRIGVAGLGRPFLRKVFPDHWSFLLGEIALYSFIVLILSGIFLTIWFKPSMAEIEYEGSYELLRGLQMSEAYASTRACRSTFAAVCCCGRCTTGRPRSSSPQCSPSHFLHRRVPQAA